MLKKTVLNAAHRALNARMVDFGGWDMPVNYGSQIEEHHAVRRDCGMFDVSHMCPVDVVGADCRAFLSRLVANDVAKLKVSGKALYAAMLNAAGGVIADLIIYFLTATRFRIIVHAADDVPSRTTETRFSDPGCASRTEQDAASSPAHHIPDRWMEREQ